MRTAIEALSGKARAPEILRYTLQLIELARLLGGVPQVVEKLGRMLDTVDPAEPDEGVGDAFLGDAHAEAAGKLDLQRALDIGFQQGLAGRVLEREDRDGANVGRKAPPRESVQAGGRRGRPALGDLAAPFRILRRRQGEPRVLA